MRNYIIKRLFLIPLTMFGILLVNFTIIQFAPGGPVEQTLAKYRGIGMGGEAAIGVSSQLDSGKYQGSQGVPEDLIKELEKQFGFDKPAHIRFFKMLKHYALFDFGKSFYKDKTVLQLIGERMPVSVSLGLWATIIIYLIAIPLGIKKAVCEYYSITIQQIIGNSRVSSISVPRSIAIYFQNPHIFFKIILTNVTSCNKLIT